MATVMKAKTRPSPRARAKKAPAASARVARLPSTAGYSGTPLPKKLGIHPNARVGLVGAPEKFEQLLEPLPDGATLSRSPRGACDLWLWFPRDQRELRTQMNTRVKALGQNGIWICWPKKASGEPTDLSENLIRDAGLAAGLVDFKVCAIDAKYSGLKLTRRKAPA
jgi:hypothetical protein